jgi:hypothetical protein
MPTRKQRRREAKAKRHEYEFVYVDAEGHELEAPPEDVETEPKRREERRNGTRPQKQAPQRQQRGTRRVPQPPSWQRSLRRAAILGAVVFVLFAFTSKNGYASAAGLAVLYTVLFVPFTYALDRFAYRRWQARENRTGPTKKR